MINIKAVREINGKTYCLCCNKVLRYCNCALIAKNWCKLHNKEQHYYVKN